MLLDWCWSGKQVVKEVTQSGISIRSFVVIISLQPDYCQPLVRIQRDSSYRLIAERAGSGMVAWCGGVMSGLARAEGR